MEIYIVKINFVRYISLGLQYFAGVHAVSGSSGGAGGPDAHALC